MILSNLVDGQESNNSLLLVEQNSGEPFTGEISRSEADRITRTDFFRRAFEW